MLILLLLDLLLLNVLWLLNYFSLCLNVPRAENLEDFPLYVLIRHLALHFSHLHLLIANDSRFLNVFNKLELSGYERRELRRLERLERVERVLLRQEVQECV